MAEMLDGAAETNDVPPVFQEFRFLDPNDTEYFGAHIVPRMSFAECEALIRERGYRDTDIPVVILRFGGESVQDSVIERLHEYSDVDIAALFSAIRENHPIMLGALTKQIALHIDIFAQQTDFAERMIEDEYLREIFVLNIGRFRNLSSAVAGRLVEENFRWAVLGHVSSFQPNAIDVQQLLGEMSSKRELSETFAKQCFDTMHRPEEFQQCILNERCEVLDEFRTTNQMAGMTGVDPLHQAALHGFSKKVLFQAVPDVELLREYRRIASNALAQEVMYFVDQNKSISPLSGEVPKILKELFEKSEQDFFSDENVDECAAIMDRERFARDRNKEGPSHSVFALKTWEVEQILLINHHHAVSKHGAMQAAIHEGRFEGSQYRRDYAKLMPIVTAAEACSSTFLQYYLLAEKIARDEHVVTPSQGVSPLFAQHIFDFFHAYAAVLPDDVSFSLGERMVNLCERDTSMNTIVLFESLAFSVMDNFDGPFRERILAKILDLLPRYPAMERRIVAKVLSTDAPELYDQVLALCQKNNLPVDREIVKTWTRCSSKSLRFQIIFAELVMMTRLEAARPGICALLRKEFGIENYARYPYGLLVEQFDTRDDHSLPYGLLINPKTDYNSAFQSNKVLGAGWQDPYVALFEQLRDVVRIRVYEAGSNVDVVRRLTQVKRRYIAPSGRKISFALIGGHGSIDSILFGEGAQTGFLTMSDLSGSGPAVLGGAYFEPGAPMVLQSCSTGKRGGIGQRLSAGLGIEVIAPDALTNVTDISARADREGKVRISVRFHNYNENNVDENNVDSVRYSAGVEVRGAEYPSP